MKNRYILLLFLLCISCHEIEYYGETRYVVQTIIKDTDGNPLQDKEVGIMVSDLEDTDQISGGRTDANGKLTVVFPAAKGDSTRYTISIIGDDFHQQKEYFNIIDEHFVDYKFSLHDIVLYRLNQITTLSVGLEQVNPNIRFDGYTIAAETPGYQVNLGTPLPEYGYYHDVTFGILTNQNVLLNYTLTDMSTMVTTDYTVEIQVANDPATYVISY
ncbi:MAG TPA: hypothetical protein VF676_10775 [Flavobacterium sp.]|jgi:5-hydroxyisourate hydrolase-like protein (transthyretin family)